MKCIGLISNYKIVSKNNYLFFFFLNGLVKFDLFTDWEDANVSLHCAVNSMFVEVLSAYLR